MGAASAALLLPRGATAIEPVWRIAGQDVEIQIAPVSAHTLRLSILPIQAGRVAPVPMDGSLVQASWGAPVLRLLGNSPAGATKCGQLNVAVASNPLTFTITTSNGEALQRLAVDEESGVVRFETGDSPLLGLGQGGVQFDRRGSIDAMGNGQGGYQLATHGARLAVPWLISASGWAMFIHQPFGTFDLLGRRASFFLPRRNIAFPSGHLLCRFARTKDHHGRICPADRASRDAAALGARLPAVAPHAGEPRGGSAVAKTFREKKLPCDALIYLGTGFCPSGWNTAHGSFAFNPTVFPDPKAMLDELHTIISTSCRTSSFLPIGLARAGAQIRCGSATVRRSRRRAATGTRIARRSPLGVDGWWPDEGDPLGSVSRLARIRMYWEGPQLDRPDRAPLCPAPQRLRGHAALRGVPLVGRRRIRPGRRCKTHVPVAINTGLTGIPYWGTDIGGFVPTKELTGELYVRWFQFGAFCPLFRSHGRTWKLRLPWGWNTGELGPNENCRLYGRRRIPIPNELHNAAVEPICRKYLELRYRLMPYLYSVVRECCRTGLPIMRALWLHDPDDPRAVARGDEYLWGRDILVAPVTEKGATTRQLYLPQGDWYDFWTGDRIEGGREITRAVDLETMPLYVRAGAILPLGPVKQYVEERIDQPLSVSIYPGSDGSFLLYEDDGKTFDYRKGEWMGTQMDWNDARRVLTLRLAEGSRMLPRGRRRIDVKLEETVRATEFDGHKIEVAF